MSEVSSNSYHLQVYSPADLSPAPSFAASFDEYSRVTIILRRLLKAAEGGGMPQDRTEALFKDINHHLVRTYLFVKDVDMMSLIEDDLLLLTKVR